MKRIDKNICPVNLKQFSCFWDKMNLEIKYSVIGAETLFHKHIDDENIPRFMLASPFLLTYKRELIQFYKTNFPKYLNKLNLGKRFETYKSCNNDLKKMILKQERISMEHLLSLFNQMDNERENELLFHLKNLSKLIDPDQEIINKKYVGLIIDNILKYRKLSVHIPNYSLRITTDDLIRIIEMIILRFHNKRGLLVELLTKENNVLNYFEYKN